MRYAHEVYGLRLSLIFETKHEDVTEIRAYLSLGPCLVNRLDIKITSRTESRVLKAIQQVLAEAAEIVDGKTELFYPLFYIKLPAGQWISTNVDTEQGIFYRSAHNMRSGEVISAIAIKTQAHFKGVARARALPNVGKLTSLMSLLADAPIAMEHPSLPKRGTFQTVRREPPHIRKVYPASYHLWEPTSLFRDIKDIASLSIRLLADDALLGNDDLWRSIYAYATAQDVQKEHPSLASVAYIASLSAFADSGMCGGTVSCSVCGTRPPHAIQSEPDSIAELVSKELNLKSDPQKKQQVRNLIRAVYSKQRSAYVHDAVLRHQEGTDVRGQVGRPGKLSPISEELTFAEQLTGIRRLARRVLLMKLPNTSLLQSLINGSSELAIVPRIPIAASVTVGRRPVGIRMRP